jgi:hypothetical protein
MSCSFQNLWQHLVQGLPEWTGWVERGIKDGLLNGRGTTGSRTLNADALLWLKSRPNVLSQAFARSLVQRMKEELEEPEAPDLAMRNFLLDSAPMLSLMDENSVQEGIEVGRIGRQIDHATEGTLRELRSLCMNLPGRPLHEPEMAYPLLPPLIAEALSQSLSDLGCESELRVPILQTAVQMLPADVLRLYEQHLLWLRDAGVSPKAPKLRMRAPTEPGGAAYIGIDRLFSAPPGTPPAVAGGADLKTSAQQAGLAPDLVTKLSQLTRVLARQSRAGAEMDGVWQRLRARVERLGPDELTSLENPKHPFWRLLDRLAALSMVQSPNDPDMRDLAARMGPMLAQLERPEPLSLDTVDSALAELNTVPGEIVGTRPMEFETALDLEARRQEIEPAVKTQLLEQLRTEAVPDVLRQFLMGPWVQVLTRALAKHGPDSHESMLYMNLVAEVLSAAARVRKGNGLSALEQQALLESARGGMTEASVPVHMVEGYLKDLTSVFVGMAFTSTRTDAQPASRASVGEGKPSKSLVPERSSARPSAAPGPVQRPAKDAVVVPSSPSLASGDDWQDLMGGDEWQGHAELTTVPMSLMGDMQEAAKQREAWMRSLKVGDMCRLMLQGRWQTALLTWQSDNGNFFMFKTRHGTGTQTVPRKVLDRLRAEGLATHIEPGQLLARALEAMPSSDD